MADITKVKVGACSVSFKGVDLGHTKGGVTVMYNPTYFDVQVDKYGKTTSEKKLVGEKFTAKVPLAEYTIANLQAAMAASGGNTTKATLGHTAGTGLLALAGLLVLHPITNAANNRAEDVVMWKATSASQVQLDHKVDGVKVIEITFEALIDESQSDGALLGLIGDSTT